MKKKLQSFLSAAFLLILGLSPLAVQGQCTPNPPSNNTGFYPDPIPSGCVGTPYYQIEQFVFPLDTTVSAPPFGTFVIPFDSFRVDSVTMIPAGIGLVLNKADSMYYPVSSTVPARGCAVVSGTPVTPTGPNDSVEVYVTAWATAPFVGVQAGQTVFKLGFEVLAAPTSAFTYSATGFNVAFTDASTGATSWGWDFGDGTTSSVQNPGTHTYSGPGTYQVCQFTDNGNCQDTTCQFVVLGCPPPSVNFSASVSQLQVAFTDGTPGSPQSWLWDFGDGNTSTSQNPNHTYAAAGTYTVCLVVTDSCGTDSTCQSISPCGLPTAGFNTQVNNLAVSFSDISSSGSSITSWVWDFGDGSNSTVQNPTNLYAAPGTYTVCLTVTDACGTDSTCASVITICNTPTANFSASAVNGMVTFTDGSVGTGISTWSWDFGDGGSATTQNPQHTYTADGTYQVCLTINDSCGSDVFCDSVQVLIVGLESLNGLTGLEIYPNPTRDRLTVSARLAGIDRVGLRVLNALGQEMIPVKEQATGNKLQESISVEQLPSGIYFLEITADEGRLVRKFIKE